jgi:hypothetical protein
LLNLPGAASISSWRFFFHFVATRIAVTVHLGRVPHKYLTVLQHGRLYISSAATHSKAGQGYTVKSGETLSKIGNQYYGNANEYLRVF